MLRWANRRSCLLCRQTDLWSLSCHRPNVSVNLSAANMLRWVNRRSFFGCGRACRQWLDACVQSFVSPFASKASSNHDAISTHVKLSASKVSRRKSISNHRDESTVCTRHAGVATISVCNAGRQDVGVNVIRALACSHYDSKGHSVDGDVKVFESATCMPYAKTHFSNGDARVTESAVCGQIQSLDSCSWDSVSDLVPNHDTYLASSSKCNDKCLPSDVSNASGKTPSSLQTLVIQTQKKAQKASPDLQQKVELLESEQFSLSDAAKLVKRRAFKSCSFEQLSTVLQMLKEIFPSAEVVRDIMVRSSNILQQPAELVQQKLKLLYDFQVEEKVVSRLCGKGRVLSLRVESLQKKLMFYKDIGLPLEARNMMFSKGPLILLLSIKNNIQPALNFLESTGLTRESIWNLGIHCPEVFYMSLDNNLIKRYEYFRQLGFSAKEFARAFRAVGRISMKRVEEHMQSLKDLGFTDEDVLLMVRKFPGILACSSENMKCKMDFLICEQNRDMAELVNDPSCLMFSLQGRMVPRLNLIKESGDSKVYLLSSILKGNDSSFVKRFGKQLCAVS